MLPGSRVNIEIRNPCNFQVIRGENFNAGWRYPGNMKRNNGQKDLLRGTDYFVAHSRNLAVAGLPFETRRNFSVKRVRQLRAFRNKQARGGSGGELFRD